MVGGLDAGVGDVGTGRIDRKLPAVGPCSHPNAIKHSTSQAGMDLPSHIDQFEAALSWFRGSATMT